MAVFRGAELKQAIAAGLVPGFGNLGRQGKVLVDDSATGCPKKKVSLKLKFFTENPGKGSKQNPTV